VPTASPVTVFVAEAAEPEDEDEDEDLALDEDEVEDDDEDLALDDPDDGVLVAAGAMAAVTGRCALNPSVAATPSTVAPRTMGARCMAGSRL
jgi:hypothetical protein